MTPLQEKSPAERCSAHGAMDTRLTEGNRMMTISQNQSIEHTAAQLYPYSFDEGRHSARLWLSMTPPTFSLHEWKERRRRWHLAGKSGADWQAPIAFDYGFERALAEHVAGGRHG